MCLDNRLKKRWNDDAWSTCTFRQIVFTCILFNFELRKTDFHASTVSEQVSDVRRIFTRKQMSWERLLIRSSSTARGDRGVGKREIEPS